MTATVAATVHHGDYRARFTGTGDTLEEAVIAAATQSTYSSGIIPAEWETDRLREARTPLWEALLEALRAGKEYRGFGWTTFSVGHTCCDGTGWTGNPRERCPDHYEAPGFGAGGLY